ncbi:pentapeptide repeat-containing protein [Polaromonas sp. JS666]|uniref:pentapeptide repeat-containing protein n=1 Tax=Polaromonas sp. (strain JS666 / ATCC BAA-500) TaxID=296591 RepID=UPI00088DC21F|nr:pentapeptide repeat-containing protein [Polaromonas sp. JS666]SDN54280.1 hypothetical protein SAMN05720382_105391 [Polaromonas sp. JS666]
MKEDEAEIARQAQWKWLFRSLDQLLRDQRHSEEQLKQLSEAFTHLLKKSHQSLEDCAYQISASANVPSLRSDDFGNSKIISVKSEYVQEFLNFLRELKEGVTQFDWDKIERPNIFIDLTAVHVDGPVTVRLKDNYLVTTLTEFLSPLRVEIYSDANIRFSNTQFRRGLTITWMNAGKLTLSDHLNSYQEEIVVDGSRIQVNSRAESHKCILDWTASTPSSIAADVSIAGCVIERMTFDRRTFEGAFRAIETKFRRIDLLSCHFQGLATFGNCEFIEEPIRFLNSTFSKPLIFSSSNFEKAPDFHGVKFHPNTRFRACRFTAAGSLFKSSCTPADVASYRVLKAHFGQQKDSRQEIVFYALEQRSERSVATGDPVETALSWFQDAVCGYGQTLSRAILVFILWNAVFGAVFQMLPNAFLSVKSQGSIADYPGVALSLQNAFNPLALFSDKGLVELHSLWMYSASLIQALGSIGIVALIILTIRGKFRKGSSSES